MQRSIARIGFWASVIALVGAIGYIVTVPLQILEWVTPLSNAYIAYAFSLIITVPFLISMLALHHTTPVEKQFWTHTAISLAIIYVTLCALNYVVQMATVLPAGYIWTFDNLEGTRGPLSVLNQTPHSLFWDVDALGYVFLNLATIFASVDVRGTLGRYRASLLYCTGAIVSSSLKIAIVLSRHTEVLTSAEDHRLPCGSTFITNRL